MVLDGSWRLNGLVGIGEVQVESYRVGPPPQEDLKQAGECVGRLAHALIRGQPTCTVLQARVGHWSHWGGLGLLVHRMVGHIRHWACVLLYLLLSQLQQVVLVNSFFSTDFWKATACP